MMSPTEIIFSMFSYIITFVYVIYYLLFRARADGYVTICCIDIRLSVLRLIIVLGLVGIIGIVGGYLFYIT